MKHLYVMRHAEAEEIEEGGNDAERPLTKKGKKAVRAMGRWMAEHGIRPDLVITSPLRRARQTAERVRKRVGSPEPATLPELSGVCSAKDLAVALGPACAGAECVLLVGHQPQLGQLVSLLVTGSPYGNFDLKKSSLCHLAVDEFRAGKCGFVDFLLNPDIDA